jgi:hypothetical protein
MTVANHLVTIASKTRICDYYSLDLSGSSSSSSSLLGFTNKPTLARGMIIYI